jgi:SAM-dependent methyltransferase
VIDARRFAPATERNREAILAVLAGVVPERARVLEIAAGSGEHACFFADRLRVADWQPTDPDPESRASIDAWRGVSKVGRVNPALPLDVATTSAWPIERADVVVCINMIHISPWQATLGLVRGAANVLEGGGVLFLYGPYRRFGAHTAPSNDAFDASLRARDPSWGVRDLEEVTRVAGDAGLSLEEVVAMPANNFSVVFRRR